MYTDDRFWEGVSNLDEAAAVPVAPCNAETRRSRSYATRQINYSLPPSECFSFSPLYCSRTRHFSPVVVYLTRKTREMLCWGHFNPSMQCALNSRVAHAVVVFLDFFLPFLPSLFLILSSMPGAWLRRTCGRVTLEMVWITFRILSLWRHISCLSLSFSLSSLLMCPLSWGRIKVSHCKSLRKFGLGFLPLWTWEFKWRESERDAVSVLEASCNTFHKQCVTINPNLIPVHIVVFLTRLFVRKHLKTLLSTKRARELFSRSARWDATAGVTSLPAYSGIVNAVLMCVCVCAQLVRKCNEGARTMERTEMMYTINSQLEFKIKVSPHPELRCFSQASMLHIYKQKRTKIAVPLIR